MDDRSALDKLSPEQQAGLSEEEKLIFCALHPSDQDFSARTFSPSSLPQFLRNKGALEQRKRDASAQQLSLQSRLKSIVPAGTSSSGSSLTETLVGGAAAVTAAVGIGVLAGKLSTDGSMTWHDLPVDLAVRALSSEFNRGDGRTIAQLSPLDDQTTRVNIDLITSGRQVPGISIQLASLSQSETKVQVSDLTDVSITEMLKERGQDALDLLKGGVDLLIRRQRNGSIDLGRMFGLGKDALDKAFDAHQSVKDLDLEDRAWECLIKIAEPRERDWEKRKRLALEDQERRRLAWKYYESCEKCSVPYEPEAESCAVCGNLRPPRPDFDRPLAG
jgi:hypothetical protein